MAARRPNATRRNGLVYRTRTKRYTVIREVTYLVTFTVEAHSQKEARETHTPFGALRTFIGETVGRAELDE